MGNVDEDWMGKIAYSNNNAYVFCTNFPTFNTINSVKYFLKIKVLRKIFKSRKVRMLFYPYKKLPKEMIAKY